MLKSKSFEIQVQGALTLINTVGHKERWRILKMVAERDTRPVEIMERMAIHRSLLDKHLAALVEQELLTKRTVTPKEVYYVINKERMAMIMCGIVLLNYTYDQVVNGA